MTTIYRLLIALAVAVPFSAFTNHYSEQQSLGFSFDSQILLIFLAACLLTALLCALIPTGGNTSQSAASNKPKKAKAKSSDNNREFGEVKWFNYNKGFGFISRDSGDDIFVHHKSIDTKGRRGLREGQRVSFIVTNTDKGLQAEDVRSED